MSLDIMENNHCIDSEIKKESVNDISSEQGTIRQIKQEPNVDSSFEQVSRRIKQELVDDSSSEQGGTAATIDSVKVDAWCIDWKETGSKEGNSDQWKCNSDDGIEDSLEEPTVGSENNMINNCYENYTVEETPNNCEKPKLLKCSICDYSSKWKSSVRNHVRAVHINIKPFKCPQCTYSSSFRKDLIQHIEAVHQKLKPYECKDCQYYFSRKSDLSRHILRVHEKVRPFKCQQCAYSCSENHVLNRHIQAVHEKLKPFHCLQCYYRCSRKSFLRQHVAAVHQQKCGCSKQIDQGYAVLMSMPVSSGGCNQCEIPSLPVTGCHKVV